MMRNRLLKLERQVCEFKPSDLPECCRGPRLVTFHEDGRRIVAPLSRHLCERPDNCPSTGQGVDVVMPDNGREVVVKVIGGEISMDDL